MSDKQDECEICEVHNEAFKEVEYTPLSCPNCNNTLSENGYLYLFMNGLGTVIADTYDKGPFIKTDLFSCNHCKQNFILRAKPVIWNANHDIYYFNPPNTVKVLDKIEIRYHSAIPNYCKLEGLDIRIIPECEGGGFMIRKDQAEAIIALIKGSKDG